MNKAIVVLAFGLIFVASSNLLQQCDLREYRMRIQALEQRDCR